MAIGPTVIVQRDEGSVCARLTPVCAVTHATGANIRVAQQEIAGTLGAHRKVIGTYVLRRTDRLFGEG